MRKVTIKKIVVLIISLIIIRLFVVYTFDRINEKNTSYIHLNNNRISAKEVIQGPTKALILEATNAQTESYMFYIEAMDKEALTLIYDGSQAGYSIYINDQLKVQNHDRSLAGYTDRVAYCVLDIHASDYKRVGDTVLAKIELRRYRDPIKNPVFYLGDEGAIRQIMDIRLIYNTAMLIGFSVMLVLSLFFYYRDQAAYMVITVLISIVSFYKSMISGELYIFSQLLNISGNNYFFYDHLTSVLNLFLYITLIYILYESKIKKVYIYGYMTLYLLLSSAFLISGDLRVYLILIIIGDGATILLAFMGYLKSKPYSISLWMAYNIFAGFNIYTIINRTNSMKQGNLSSIVFGPQIGSFIFIFAFLMAVIGTYFNKMKVYEQQQIEYEKVSLLRGISHDLKLPLSVIQLNNQMIMRYKMTSEERTDYIKSSIEATQELEKMTENINCYLNMNSPVIGANQTSIRDSFIKLRSQYRSRKYNREILTVNLDEKDCLLLIEPLEFERMLYNLIENAFKYNKNNNKVTISYIISKKVMIVIEDSGVGMKEEDLKRIFEPFYKTDNSRSKEGFGLGLSVVKGIVDKLKGEIEVESEVGIGTKITLMIPK